MSYFNSITRINNRLTEFIDSADPVYGTGMDGDATLDGSTTVLGMIPVAVDRYLMTRDLYFNNLTLNAGVTLQPNGFRIFVKNTLAMGAASRIGFTTGFSTSGSIAQGGGINQAVTNGLGGSSATAAVSAPAESLGGTDYYKVPQQAIRGWAVSASSTSPTFLRGGAGGIGQEGGGVVILAARYMTVTSGTATISAPATAPAGGGVILIVSSHSSLPQAISTDVTGQNPGRVHYMQLV